jgi:FkbM family methyltransferase
MRKKYNFVNRIYNYIRIFSLNRTIFIKKATGRILLEIYPSPKGTARVKVGTYTIDVFPSRNRWWKSMYIGCCGVEIIHNIKKFLNPGGVFIDVGAGIGYFSAIASDIVGITGQVHCFEPCPKNVVAIQRMLKSNPGSNIVLNDLALGLDNSIHEFNIKREYNATKASMNENVINPKEASEIIKVKTRRLDNYLEEEELSKISLIKIDVEGYEFFVLKGLSTFFEKMRNKPPIICEIDPYAYKEKDASLLELYNYMKNYGYQAFNIFNSNVATDIRKLGNITDVVFRIVK